MDHEDKTNAPGHEAEPVARRTPSVSNRLLRDIEMYIRHNTGVQGYMQVPVRRMCEDLGCSHASIHRALAVLETEGKVAVDRSQQPPIVRYHDAQETPDPAGSVLTGVRSAIAALSALEKDVERLAHENEELRRVAAEWSSLRNCLVDKVYMPNSQYLLLTFKVQDKPDWV